MQFEFGASIGGFSVKQTSDGRYIFNLIANNNRVISSFQTYILTVRCGYLSPAIRDVRV